MTATRRIICRGSSHEVGCLMRLQPILCLSEIGPPLFSVAILARSFRAPPACPRALGARVMQVDSVGDDAVAAADARRLAAVTRGPLITRPMLCVIWGSLSGAAAPVHVVIACDSGAARPGATILVEQRTWMAALNFGDLVKRRKKEKKDLFLECTMIDWGIAPEHASLPCHDGDSIKGIAFSFSLLGAWMVGRYFMYEKARGAHGSQDKQVRLVNGMRDFVSTSRRGIAGIGPAGPRPTLHIGGVNISISSEFDLDMSSVLPVFANLPASFDAVHAAGGLGPAGHWPSTNIVPAFDMLMFLCRRVALGRLDLGNVLKDFRNGLMQLVGAKAERQAFSTLTSRKRKPHQEQPTSIYGKTGKRRARKSLVEIVQTLELAENAGHAEAVVRSSGSNWPLFYKQKHKQQKQQRRRQEQRASERASASKLGSPALHPASAAGSTSRRRGTPSRTRPPCRSAGTGSRSRVCRS